VLILLLHQVPASLLVLMSSFNLTERRHVDQSVDVKTETLSAVISSLEKEAVDEALESSGVEADAKKKLAVLRRQNEIIKEEEEVCEFLSCYVAFFFSFPRCR
jgi:hypothetical protein